MPEWNLEPERLACMVMQLYPREPEEIVIETRDYLYALEADSVGDALAQGRMESPHMTVADTLGNMAALDAWRASAGLVYESEKPSVPSRP